MILGHITTLQIEELERSGTATITEAPAEYGVVSFALVFERELEMARAAAETSRAPAHLHEHLVAAMCASATGMAKRERLRGHPMSIEKFAESCIRATIHALNERDNAVEAK
jgi:hypothetical protein